LEEVLMTLDQHIAVYVGVWVAQKNGVLSGIDRLNLQREINAFLIQRGEYLTAAGCSLLDQMVNLAVQVVLAKKAEICDTETRVIPAVGRKQEVDNDRVFKL
jgi:hypothetical protein